MATDLIETLIDDWKVARPDLNSEAMGVTGRILRLARLFEDDVANVLKEFTLQYTELDVLATLRRKGPPFRLNPKQLMKSVLLTSGAMTACLDRLEKRQLIRRTTDPGDRRGRLIALTAKGRKLIDKAIEVRFFQAQRVLTGLSKKEQNELAKLLSKLSRLVDKTN